LQISHKKNPRPKQKKSQNLKNDFPAAEIKKLEILEIFAFLMKNPLFLKARKPPLY